MAESRTTSTRWTYEERCYLKQYYNVLELSEIAATLGRSEKSIYNQVYYLRKRGWKFNRNGNTNI